MRRTNNQLKFVQQTLYALKREYGVAGDLYNVTSDTVDPETGVRTWVREKHHIKKLILLPTNVTVQMFIAGGFIRPDPSFPSAGREVTDAFAVVEQKDLDVEVTKDFYVVINHKRYNIASINEIEQNIGLLIGLKRVKDS